MDTIILKSDLGRTCDEFVEGLFAGKMGVCALRQTKFLLGGVVEYGTTLVSALAKGLRPDRRVSPKKQREMVSRHLGALDILPALQDVLCARTPLPADTVNCKLLDLTSPSLFANLSTLNSGAAGAAPQPTEN